MFARLIPLVARRHHKTKAIAFCVSTLFFDDRASQLSIDIVKGDLVYLPDEQKMFKLTV